MSHEEKVTDPEAEALKRRLHTRVKRRKWSSGSSWVLDLRAARFPGRGILTLRDPEAPGWPDRGPKPRTKDEALLWVDDYVDRLGTGWFEGAHQPRTVAVVAEGYLADLEENAPRNTYINRRSAVTRHILPRFGASILEGLVAEEIRTWLAGLRGPDGAPLAPTTLETILATLGELWRFEIPGRRTPWKGKISLSRENGAVRRRRLAEGGERPERVRAYDIAQLRTILGVAQRLDAEAFADPKKHRAVPDTAYVIAFLFYLGLRVEEVTFLRRQDVHLDLGVLFAPGTKTESARRYVPIQTSFRPWLMDILERVPADPEAWLFPNSGLTGRALPNTLQGRVTDVLQAARLKVRGKATHIFRASHITIALGSRRVAPADLDRFMGHTDGSIRDRHYLDPAVFAASLQRGHFDYLPSVCEPEGREMLVEDRIRRERWAERRREG